MGTSNLSSVVDEMRDLVAIERGLVSPRELANRAYVVAPGFVVPRGYMHDKLDQAAAEAAWEEECDSEENLAAVAEWMKPADHLVPPPPEPEPRAEPDLEPEPERESPGGLFRAMRRRLHR